MKKIKVFPWIGKNYYTPKTLPHKTLIMGESNYTDENNFNSNLVIECIKDYLDKNEDKSFSRFATKILRVILGENTKVDKQIFWNDIAFYNYVQYLVGNKSGDRPSFEMWQKSFEAFEEIINELKPERILVLGKQNWENLLSNIKSNNINIENIDEYTIKTNIDNQNIIIGYIVHPSSGGGYFTYKIYHPIAKKIVFENF